MKAKKAGRRRKHWKKTAKPGEKTRAGRKAGKREKLKPAARKEGFAYDLYGTLVLTDCLASGNYAPRKGVLEVLGKQKAEGRKLACFADDDKQTVESVLEKSGLRKFFDEVHYGHELDEEGLKQLARAKFKVLAFSGDMPRDERAAEKYGAGFVKVPPYTVESNPFDFRKAGQAIRAGTRKNWVDYAKENALKWLGGEKEIELDGEGQRIKAWKERWVARFY